METKEDRGTTSEGNNCYNEVEETLDSTKETQFEFELEGASPFSRKIMTKLLQVSQNNRKNYIYRVDDSLRVGNEQHYEPLLFSIGPYHRGKSKLQHMEEYKWRSLNRLTKLIMDKRGISRSDQINRYYEVLKELEDDARAYYAEFISLEEDEFLEMLLLDGCFLIETLSETTYFSPNMDWVLDVRRHDLLLLENQLPFFVLNRLFETMKAPGEHYPLMLHILTVLYVVPLNKCIKPHDIFYRDVIITTISVHYLLVKVGRLNPDTVSEHQELTQSAKEMGVLVLPEIDPEKLKNTTHLLDLAYKVLFREDLLDVTAVTTTTISITDEDHLLDVDRLISAKYFNTYSVTELSNAGVKFKSVADKKFYDIQFKNGTLEIPMISIQRDQTGQLRNLIAYERSSPNTRRLCDYISFMDSLINSGKDVELLRIHGIMQHYLGDDEAVSTMFNKIGSITETSYPFYYSSTVNSLKDHCRKRRNIWMAKLRSEYFSNPWTIISVIAAFVLLVLTVIQTVYSSLSYYKG